MVNHFLHNITLFSFNINTLDLYYRQIVNTRAETHHFLLLYYNVFILRFITCKIYFEKRTSKLKQNNYETLIFTVVNFFTSTLTQGRMRKKTTTLYSYCSDFKLYICSRDEVTHIKLNFFFNLKAIIL